MKVKKAIKILKELVTMSKEGLDTEIVIKDRASNNYVIARPQLLEVIDISVVNNEFRGPNNNDEERNIINVILIDDNEF